MSVLIAGTLEINAKQRSQALADSAALMAETRSQQGCQHYVWAADPTSDTRIYVYENWSTSEDLAAHLNGPFYAKMLGILSAYEIFDTHISKFKSVLEEPVYDPDGNPRGDFFTESQ